MKVLLLAIGVTHVWDALCYIRADDRGDLRVFH